MCFLSTQEILGQMNELGVQPDVHTFNNILRLIHREDSRSKEYNYHTGYIDKMLAVLSEMRALGIGRFW